MNEIDIDREIQLQALALRPAGDGEQQPDPAKPYRLIYAAVRAAPIDEPPPGFAAFMARRLEDAGEQAQVEEWITRIAVICATLVVLFYAVPLAIDQLSNALAGVADLPWPMLGAAGVALTMTWLVDAVVDRRHWRGSLA